MVGRATRAATIGPVYTLLVVVLACAWSPAPLRAATADEQAAEKMFQQGLADMLAGRYATACPAIAQSLRLDKQPGTLFTLAECEAKAGLVASAHAHHQEFLTSLETLPPDRRERQRERERIARSQIEGLAARLPLLTLRLPADASGAVVVKRNDVVVDPALLGRPVPVDPGTHELRVEGAGEVVTQTVTLAEREHRDLLLRVPPPPAPSATPPAPFDAKLAEPLPPVPSDPPAAPDRPLRWRRWGAGLAGAGAVVAALGGASLFIAHRKADAIEDAAEARESYDPSNGNFQTFERAGYAMLAAGAAALIGGTISYLLGRRM